jgi:hypothetical protein
MHLVRRMVWSFVSRLTGLPWCSARFARRPGGGAHSRSRPSRGLHETSGPARAAGGLPPGACILGEVGAGCVLGFGSPGGGRRRRAGVMRQHRARLGGGSRSRDRSRDRPVFALQVAPLAIVARLREPARPECPARLAWSTALTKGKRAAGVARYAPRKPAATIATRMGGDAARGSGRRRRRRLERDPTAGRVPP